MREERVYGQPDDSVSNENKLANIRQRDACRQIALTIQTVTRAMTSEQLLLEPSWNSCRRTGISSFPMRADVT